MAKYVRKKKSKDPSFRKVRSKYYPVARRMGVDRISGAAAASNTIIQVDKLLSIANQRLYRQHGSYTVKLDLHLSGTAVGVNTIPVFALMPTWWVINSIRQAKAHFDEAMKEEDAQTKRARWYDFRIWHNATDCNEAAPHAMDLTGGLPSEMSGADEYQYSEVRCTDAQDRKFKLTGATNAVAYNIFTEYDNMGNSSIEPVQLTNGAYELLTADIEEENTIHLTAAGNEPPYDGDSFPHKMWVQVGTLYNDNDGSQKLSTGYFEAPLGLIYLPGTDITQAPGGAITMEVKSGGYKGVDFTAY